MNSKPWRGGRGSRRMSTEDSTEDLISKQNDSGDRQRLNIDDNDTSIDIKIPRDNTYNRPWRKKTVNVSFLVLSIVFLLIAVVFICLYFHQKDLLDFYKNKEKSSSSHVKPTHAPNCTDNVCVTPGCVEAAAFMQAAMDTTINPCDDFYLYSCAGWIKRNPIPDGESAWDTISVVMKRNQRILKDILEDPRVKKATDVTSVAEHNAYKIFRSCKNLKRINKQGIQPLVSLMNDVTNFVTLNSTDTLRHKTLMSLFTTLYKQTRMQPFFSISVGHDDKDSSKNILQFYQSGITMAPYIYDEKTNQSKQIVEESIKYMVALGSKIDHDFATVEELREMANDVYEFEKSLKQIYVPPEKLVTIDQMYHKTTLKE
eukprot:TCONS_00060229-protein